MGKYNKEQVIESLLFIASKWGTLICFLYTKNEKKSKFFNKSYSMCQSYTVNIDESKQEAYNPNIKLNNNK